MHRELRESRPRIGTGAVLPWSALLLTGLWTWAIWSCAEHWQGNPNYSYGWAVPLLTAGFVLRRYLSLENLQPSRDWSVGSISIPIQIVIGLIAVASIFFLEYSREQMWHQEIVLLSICLVTVVSTLAAFRIRGGNALARAELFPILFFLTAVPWPPRFEQPIVSSLMRWVAQTTTELLHWFGIQAQTSGAAIALRNGLVGISEACSGVRSLQAGIMFGLAMGEWFRLRLSRRLILLVLAIALAFASNLARTLALSLQAEWHGIESLDRVHDLVGNVTVTALVATIWIAGRFLALPARSTPLSSFQNFRNQFRAVARSLIIPASPLFRTLAVSLVLGILAARALSAWTEVRDQTQTAPRFATKIDDLNHLRRIPQEIWNELRPTSGQCVRRQSKDLPGGAADCFHFFWKPSPWNRFALVHRPDICMPGVGWTSTGTAQPLDLTLNGYPLHCNLFRFKRGETYALELWGMWRNGEPVPLGYEPDQVLPAAVASSSLQFEGKRRSATEIVACSVIAEGGAPRAEIAVALLRSVFEYKGHD